MRYLLLGRERGEVEIIGYVEIVDFSIFVD
jgi:hypothetical protein